MGIRATTTCDEELRIDPDGWDAALALSEGPQLVIGGAGTGKTEFLVRRIERLVTDAGVSGSRIVVLSFGRRGVADVELRLRRRLATPSPPVVARTFHSLAAALVERHAIGRDWPQPPQILTGPEQTALIRELLGEEDPAEWSPAFRHLLASTTFAEEVTDFVLRASEQMLSRNDLASLAAVRQDWRGLPGFVARYRRRLRQRSRIDYGMLLAEATEILETEPAASQRFDYVLVDEYQDTTLAQVRLLRALAAPHGNVTVAADPHQAIYGFRGAAVDNVARFGDTFPGGDGAGARRIVLTTSFRTPAAVLAAAERLVADDLPGNAGPVTPANGAGRVDVHVFEQQTAEAEWVAGEIVRLHLVDRLPYGRMAVFVRSKRRFLPELSRALHRRGVPHDPPASRVAEQPAARFVLDLVTAACGDPTDAVRALRRILLGPWFELPLGSLRNIERRGRALGLTWTDAMRCAAADLAPLAELLEDSTWANDVRAVDGVWQVWSGLPQLAAVVSDEGRSEERAAWASLTQVLGRWNQRNPHGTLADYRRLVANEEFEARPLLSYSVPDHDRLTVTTMHQAKGLEFDVVFVCDAVEGVLPDLRLRDSLLGVRHLLPEVPTGAPDYRRFRLQEERRLAYTATSRATRRVVWTATSTGFDGGRGVPSRFLALVAGTSTVTAAASVPPASPHPVTPAEAEARLRRTVADPASAATARLAALDLLAQGGRRGLRDPWTFNGMRQRGRDDGLVAGALRLTPSHAEAYAACPRRYALERRLAVGRGAGPHAALGRLVHAAIEAAERRALATGEARGHLEDALAALAADFPTDDFGGEPQATAWRRRAEAALRSLYERWPSGGRVVAVEHEIRTELGGIPWVGRIDRVEAEDGRLRIVDYKTTSTATSHADAAGSLQLGFYLLAAARDESLAGLGNPVAAEFWFPYASRHQRQVAVRKFDLANLEQAADLLAAAAAGIRNEAWPPLPSAACERCPVRSVCPAHPEGAEGFAG